MQRSLVRQIVAVAGAAVALGASAPAAHAQDAVFSGTVSSIAGPLGGASVGIPELGVGSITGIDGRYSFTLDVGRTAGRSVTMVVRYIGYKPKRMAVTLVAGRVDKDFELERDVLSLEQVVVTGVSDATSQQKTAFSVSVVDNSAIKDAPFQSPVAALAGKVAGASVVSTSGQPGDAPAIRLRSATSLTGRQDPLVIVDGTITRLGLADINAEDIERIEVIKGAAASSLYGSDAANGVVQIFTKRGANLAEGQTVVQVRNEYGRSQLPRFIPGNTSHNYEVNADGSFKLDTEGNRVTEADGISDNDYPVLFNQGDQVFRNGEFMTNYVSVGQRRGNLNYNASFQNTKETGVLNLLSGFSRQNFRLNLDQSMSDKVDYQVGAFYGRSTADQAEGSADIFFGLRFLEPNIDLTSPNADGSPYNANIKQPPASGNLANPLYALNNAETSNGRDRFTGTFKLRYRPVLWLTAEGNVNYDQSARNYKSFRPTGFLNSTGLADKGSLYQQSRSDRAMNLGATLTSVRQLTSWLANTSKLAWVMEDQTNSFVEVEATALTVPRVPEFSAASRDPSFPIQPGSGTEIIRNQNLFAVTTFDIKDRYIVDALIRRDQSSLFGADQRTANYYRLSGVWRVTEDIKLPGIDELKLRASYGTAGLRPIFNAQYEVLSVSGGSPQKITLGNPDLRPALSKEMEYGVNVNFLTNFTFEYSYSDKVTSDQILRVPVSSASGYRNQWRNAGELSGYTHEVALGAVLLSKKDFFWRMNVVGDRTRQTITDLNVGPFLVGPDDGDANTRIFRIAKGQKFGVIYGARWITSEQQLATTLAAGGLTGSAADYLKNEEGFYVRRSQHRTLNEVPLKYVQEDGTTLMEIGDVNPDFNLGFGSNVQWKVLSIGAQLNWVKGGEIYNYTRQWPFNELRDAAIDQRDKPEAERKPTSYYSTFYNNFDSNDYFVENGTYLRLRELSVNLAVPKSWMAKFGMGGLSNTRIGIVGRNLWTSTSYSGYDPDVAGPGGGNPFGYRVDYFTYPSYRTYTVMLELGY
ncbi:MAG: SusC/RagA family TonB-linked outer membrane protein [Gemmatimonadaceae bacterium]|nr:SusC/RagA family TonB-linked outer membrane protein [Gemmatimonadaceae bacterium]